jgi:hypothetical protein
MAVASHGETCEHAAIFTIRAQGKLAPNWSASPGDLTSAFTSGARQFPIVVVSGRLSSQTALLSVLEDLYELGLPLLSLTVVDETVRATGTASGPMARRRG